MIKQKYLLILLIIYICSVCLTLPVSGEANENNHLEELIAHLEQRIPALMNSYNIPGVAIALVEDGETAWPFRSPEHLFIIQMLALTCWNC